MRDLDEVAGGAVRLCALGNDSLHVHVLLHQLLLHLPLHILQLRLLRRQKLARRLRTAILLLSAPHNASNRQLPFV